MEASFCVATTLPAAPSPLERGDELYGARQPFGPRVELQRDRIIALHARSLTFLHPIRYEPITVTAPLPETWGDLAPADVSGPPGSGALGQQAGP